MVEKIVFLFKNVTVCDIFVLRLSSPIPDTVKNIFLFEKKSPTKMLNDNKCLQLNIIKANAAIRFIRYYFGLCLVTIELYMIFRDVMSTLLNSLFRFFLKAHINFRKFQTCLNHTRIKCFFLFKDHVQFWNG